MNLSHVLFVCSALFASLGVGAGVDRSLVEYYSQVTNLWNSGKYDEAKKLSDERIAKCPDDLTAWLVRGSCDYRNCDLAGISNSFPRIRTLSAGVNTPMFQLFKLKFDDFLTDKQVEIQHACEGGKQCTEFFKKLNRMLFGANLTALENDGYFGSKPPNAPSTEQIAMYAQLLKESGKLKTKEEIAKDIEEAVPKYAIGNIMCAACRQEKTDRWMKATKVIARRWPNGKSTDWKLRMLFHCPKHGDLGVETKTEYIEGIPEYSDKPSRVIPTPITDEGM